jgi:3-deoxy-D-manno-octulosonic-acid transferase
MGHNVYGMVSLRPYRTNLINNIKLLIMNTDSKKTETEQCTIPSVSNCANLKKIIEALPHAFDHAYWNMADTNYKEEILIAAWDEDVITDLEAHNTIDELFDGRKLLHQIINGEVKEVMGCYIEA